MILSIYNFAGFEDPYPMFSVMMIKAQTSMNFLSKKH